MKRMLSVLLTLVLMLSLTACSSDAGEDLSFDNSELVIPAYPVDILVRCALNLVFSKYDVDVYIDSELLGTLDHGTDRHFTTELTEGSHTITFEKEGDPSVDGELDFTISAPTEITYDISCHNDQIKAEEIFFLEKAENRDQSDAGNTTTVATEAENTTTANNKSSIKVPASASTYTALDYNDVMAQLKAAGFTNVKTKGVYDLNDGFIDSLLIDTVDSVSINGITDFKKGDLFDKSAKIVISYRTLETKNPNISYKKYSVRKLLNDLEENALAAKEKHKNEYVAITGKVDNIDASGKYFYLAPSDEERAIETIQCSIKNEEQKNQLKKLKKGKVVTVKGKITVVGEILGYSMDVHVMP